MSVIVLIGLNHKSAPLEIRERLAFSKEETLSAIEFLQNYIEINEVLLFSTCNRVEILLTTGNPNKAIQSVKKFLSDIKKIKIKQFEDSLYIYIDDNAVRHIFRVTSSLDSMVVGEPQILGQIKEAYLSSTSKNTSGVILNRLLHRAFFVAKRIRTETGIGDNAVSISYAAIELGRKIFGSLEDKKVLLVGAGEMAELAVEHLIRNKSGEIFVANRTFKKGVELASKFNGKAIRIEEIAEFLKIVDILISSTGSPDMVITRSHVKSVMRKRRNRPLFFIDIAVPRDIDPEINRLNNAYVYDIDDLKGVIEENIEERNKEAIKGERIVEEAVIRFRYWFENLDVIPTIVGLRKKMDSIANVEIKKTFHSLKHLSQNDHIAIKKMTDALINKILHDPTIYLKGDNFHGNKSTFVDILRKLFNLDN